MSFERIFRKIFYVDCFEQNMRPLKRNHFKLRKYRRRKC